MDPETTKAVIEVHGEGKGRRFQITYRGQTMNAAAWAGKIGLTPQTLTGYICEGRDITPLLRGEPLADRRRAPISASLAEPSIEAASQVAVPIQGEPAKAATGASGGKAVIGMCGGGFRKFYTITFRGKTMGVGAWLKEAPVGRSALLQALQAGDADSVARLLRGKCSAYAKPGRRMLKRISHPDYVPTVPVQNPQPAPAPTQAFAVRAPVKPYEIASDVVDSSNDYLTVLRAKLAKVDELDEKKACVAAELAELERERAATIAEIQGLFRS